MSRICAIMIDNYDSFTFNLVQYFQQLKVEVITIRNDVMDARALLAKKPDFFVLSPGPSTPDQAGVCLDLIKAATNSLTPLFGVCLGHQAIGQAFGGKVIRASSPRHGKTSAVRHEMKGVFANLPSPLEATRYHSLVVERASLPPCLEITAETDDGTIMGLRHESKLIEGVQFHPESVLTEHGMAMLANFVKQATSKRGKS